MLDLFNRKINYLRLSVTDRCNLRCTYCIPEDGAKLIPKSKILSLEEIVEAITVGAELGIEKIRLTGGEPLVRKGIVDLVAMINAVPNIKEITMTSNGVLLPKFAKDLKKAGLSRINISLDTLSAEEYKSITRVGNIEDVKAGIMAAIKEELTPVKINIVKLKSSKIDHSELEEFCKAHDIKYRYIHQMNLKTGEFSEVNGGDGGNCKICNRLRLLANGDVKPCLFDNRAYNIKDYGIKEAFMLALRAKPEKGSLSNSNEFYNLGG